MTGRIAVLLSASRHPLSGRPVPPRGELQALALAKTLGGGIVGLHAGPDPTAARQALGHGLGRLAHLVLPEGADPVLPLARFIGAEGVSLVLAGPRSIGGDETGLVPYRLAEALGWEIAAGAVALDPAGKGMDVVQALPRGERRVLAVRGPLVAVAHPGGPMPAPYAFAQERRGRVETRGAVFEGADERDEAIEERPLRRRATIAAEGARGAGTRLVAPEPEAAARAILAELRRIRAVS